MLKDALAPDRANDGDIRLWGMSCAQLHKAYWSSHGVACVRLGSGEVPQPGADLYLLLESNQSVVFDLRAIAESLLWNRAHITRLRLVEKASKQYGEFLQLDSRGDITKIERRYRAADCASTQVLLGTRMTDASIWSAAGSSALAFAAMRKGGRLRSDATECVGQQFDLSTQSCDGLAASGSCALGRNTTACRRIWRSRYRTSRYRSLRCSALAWRSFSSARAARLRRSRCCLGHYRDSGGHYEAH